jgi:hypothetical protein
MSQEDKWAFKALKQIDSISVEENVSMQMAKKSVAAEVKGLVGGRNCSLQRQVLPKDKTKTLMIFNRAQMAHEVPGHRSLIIVDLQQAWSHLQPPQSPIHLRQLVL